MCKFIRHIIWLLSPRKTVYGYIPEKENWDPVTRFKGELDTTNHIAFDVVRERDEARNQVARLKARVRQLERAMLDEVGSFPAQPESEER
jgi:hypothetical protein